MSDKRKQGELESEILSCLWDRPAGLTSQQLLALLGEEVKLTTVLTVLSRLQDKGLVSRTASAGRSFMFAATETREQHTAKQLIRVLENGSNPASVFSHFTQSLTDSQIQELRRVLEK